MNMTSIEQIQKERLEDFSSKFPDGLYDCLPDGEIFFDPPRDEFARVQTFISEAIRIAYEAGQGYGMTHEAINCYNHSKKAHAEGFRAGLERAKDLVPELPPTHRILIEQTGAFRCGFSQCITGILSALDAELAKDTL